MQGHSRRKGNDDLIERGTTESGSPSFPPKIIILAVKRKKKEGKS